MVESVDTPDLKSCDQKWSCRFDPGSGYTAKTFVVLAFFICGSFGYLPLETPNRPADDNGDRSVTTAIRPTFDPGSGYTAKTFAVLAFFYLRALRLPPTRKPNGLRFFSYKESIHKKTDCFGSRFSGSGFYSSGSKSSFVAPHKGHAQSSGRSSKAVPAGTPFSGSPTSGS